jgi:Bcr/CflA subfamily drug resistance transporter
MITLLPVLLVFYEVTTYLSTDMYLPALPQLMHDLDTTHHLAQLTITTWFFGTASMQLILGPISDYYGRRPVLLLGGVMFVIATIICATTHTIILLLAARFFQGCAVCSVVVAGYATVHELYKHKQAIQILALMSSITILAPTFGPLIGGLVLHIAHWRVIFWILAIWAIIALLLLCKYMPETNSTTKTPFSMPILLNNYHAILFNNIFLSHTLVLCLLFSGFIVWLSAAPFLIIDTFHYTPLMFGIFQAIVFSGYILGARCVKYGLEHIGSKQLIKVGVCVALSGALLAFLLAHSLMGFILAFTLYATGSALAFGSLNRTAIAACDEPMGLRIAVFSTLMSLTAALTSAGISTFYNGKIMPLGAIIFVTTFLAAIIHYTNLRWHP